MATLNTDNIKTLAINGTRVKTAYFNDEQIRLICKIQYDANGAESGTAPDFQEGSYGDTITLRTNTGGMTITGKYLAGWNTQPDGSGTTYQVGGEYTIEGDATLYALWLDLYVITFSTNMASGTYYYISGQSGNATTVAGSSRYVTPGDAVGTLPTYGSSSSGYTYTLSSVSYSIYVVGWYKESSMTNAVSASTVPTESTTYYAKWKMRANVGISASITVPKFATSVSWTCKSNSASRSAISKASGSTKGAVALVMAAPVAGSNSDSYTWTGAIGGKALTLASQSLTLNGVTRSVSTPSNAATASGVYNVYTPGTGAAISVTVFNTSNLKCIVSRPQASASQGGNMYHFTATWYYGSTQVGSEYIADVRYKNNDGDLVKTITDQYSNKSWTFSSTGGYGRSECSVTSSHNASIGAITGSGYSRTVTVNA